MAMTASGNFFICYRCACREGNAKPQVSLFTGTYFEKANLTPKQVILLSYYWCKQYGSCEDVQFETGLSCPTIVQWFQFMRDICAEYFVRNPEKIGGPGKIMEIDETCVSRDGTGLGSSPKARA